MNDFASRIVVRIPFETHADLGAILLQQSGVIVRGVLHTAIGMMHQSRRGPPLTQCHGERPSWWAESLERDVRPIHLSQSPAVVMVSSRWLQTSGSVREHRLLKR